MPFYGVVHDNSAVLAILESDTSASLRLVLNTNNQAEFNRTGAMSPHKQIAACSPLWLADRCELGHVRSVLFVSLPGETYSGIAKGYRQYAKEHGLLVTLREKIEQTPALASIIGGPWVHLKGGYPFFVDQELYRFTWKDVHAFIDDLRDNIGVRRGLLTLWIGYQQLPPDFYPFHPAQGSIEDLQRMMKYARTRDFLINFYHGYPALLEDAPNGGGAHARKSRNGSTNPRWGRNCPYFFMEHARNNLPHAVRDSGMACDYNDIFTACGFNECWDQDHPLSKAQDRVIRNEVMEYIKSLGLFSGSECPVGYAIPYLSYFRGGGATAGTHPVLSQFPVPLFNLVFKDCAILYGQSFPNPDISMMRDLAAGCHIQTTIWSLKSYYSEGYYRTRMGIKKNIATFQDWNHATGLSELVSHEFIDELNGPYRARFSDGSEALANFTTFAREIESEQIAPESLKMKFADGRVLYAMPQQGWELRYGQD